MYNTPQEIYNNRNKIGKKQSIELLINQINSSNRAEVRKLAVKYFGEIADEEYSDVLENVLLSDKSDLVRTEAAIALRRFKTEKILEPLKWIVLNEKNLNLKKQSLISVQNICNPNDEIEFFTKTLASDSKEIRKIAIESILLIEPSDRIKIIVDNIKIKKPAIRIEFLNVLNDSLSNLSSSHIIEKVTKIPDYQTKLVGRLIKFLKKTDPQIVELSSKILTKLKNLAVEELLEALNDENYLIRKNVIIILGNIKNKYVAKVLAQKLDDIYNEVNISCIEALGKIGDESAIEPLLNILDIEDESFEFVDYDLKWYVIEAVKNIYQNNPSIPLDILYNYLDTDKNIFKENIPIIIGDIRNTTAIRKLIALLEDPHLEIRKNAIIALGKICSKQCINPIVKIFDKDTYWLLKKVAIDAIDSICENAIDDEAFIEEVVQHITKLLDDENPTVRASAVSFLGNYGNGKVLEYLLRCVGDFHGKVRLLATNAIKKIEKKIEDENQDDED